MERVEIRLFGSPRIEAGGRVVALGRRKAVALVAYLALREGSRSRDALAALLWPERPGEIPRAELRRTISFLRARLGSGFVRDEGEELSLAPEAWVDALEFEALIARAEAHCGAKGQPCPDCEERLEAAVRLYRADFLAGFSLAGSAAFDDWTIFESGRLRDRLGSALERLSQPRAGAAREPCIEYARSWLRLDELDEAALRRLMLLYAEAGQRSAALRQYEAAEERFAKELGAALGRETKELRAEIESGELSCPIAPQPERRPERPEAAGKDDARPRGGRLPRKGLRKGLAAALAAAVLAAGAALMLAQRPQPGVPIAVLPLSDGSSDAGQAWFPEGMTEAITTDLAKIEGLRVTSHGSVLRFQSSRAPAPEIAKSLGVDYLIEGSVLRSGERVRITAQLIDARGDRHVWAEDYQGELSDVIGLQGEVAADVAGQVAARLGPRAKEILAAKRSVDPAAYEAYLLGSYELAHLLPIEPSAAAKALEDLQRSARLDPLYAPTHAALANYYWGSTQFGLYASEEGLGLARAEAERAVELDPGLSEAHTVLGFVAFLRDLDWKLSEREFRLAVKLKPSSAEAHCWYGSLLCSEGRFKEAIAEATKARELDPLSLVNILNVAMRYYYARDYDAAIEAASDARDMEEGFYMSHLVLGYALAAKGDYPRAEAELRRSIELAGDGAMEPLAVLDYVCARDGRGADAADAERRLAELGAKGLSISPLLRAYLPLGRGDYGEALGLIEEARGEGDLNLAWNFQDPFFDPLRSLPRFAALKKGMGL